MTESDAKALLDICAKIFDALGEMDSIVSSMIESQEKASYVKALGKLLEGVTFDFIIPVSERFPDLRRGFEQVLVEQAGHPGK